MTTRKLRHRVLLTALILGTALHGRAIAQEIANQGELSRTLETADLSPQAKALVREKALEAMRAGVSEGDVAELIRRGLDRGVRAEELVRLFEVVTEARRHNLPMRPVLDKVKEGLAKRVPPERIVSAASRISRELATAHELIQRAERQGVRVEKARTREKAVEAVADALARGVSPSDVERLSRHVAGASRGAEAMALLDEGVEVTADLVSMGLSPQDAVETVAAAISQGLNRHDVKRLRKGLARELKDGASPAEGAQRLREEIRSGWRGDDRPPEAREVTIDHATVPSVADVLARFTPGIREVHFNGLSAQQANEAFLSKTSNVLVSIGNRLADGQKVGFRAGPERFRVKKEDGQVQVRIDGVPLDAKTRRDLGVALSSPGRFEARGVDPTTGTGFRVEFLDGVLKKNEVEADPISERARGAR